MGKVRPFCGSGLEANLLRPYRRLQFEEICLKTNGRNFFNCRWKPGFFMRCWKNILIAQSAHPNIKLIKFCRVKILFSCNTSNNNNNNFIPHSCMKINFRAHDTFTRALFWKIWLPCFMEQKSSLSPLKQWSSLKIQARLGFSMPKNHIYNNSLFCSTTAYEFFKIFLYCELSVPFSWVGNSHCWVTSNDCGCPLITHAHLYHNGPQLKYSIEYASKEANFDCGLKR